MIYLYEVDGIQVLSFDSTEEARSVGRHLADMGDDHHHYARGEDASKEDLLVALKAAAGREKGSTACPRP